MVRSKIIIDLIEDNKDLSRSLEELMVICYELDNKELIEWIKSELNGYTGEVKIPDYRKNLPIEILYSGINGIFKIDNKPLPISAFGDKNEKIMSLNVVTNSIRELENTSDRYYSRDLTIYSALIKEKIGISCTNISMRFGENMPDIIISNVKTKVIESLLILEKEFGQLDDYYIDDSNITNDKVNKINCELKNILYSNDGQY